MFEWCIVIKKHIVKYPMKIFIVNSYQFGKNCNFIKTTSVEIYTRIIYLFFIFKP